MQTERLTEWRVEAAYAYVYHYYVVHVCLYRSVCHKSTEVIRIRKRDLSPGYLTAFVYFLLGLLSRNYEFYLIYTESSPDVEYIYPRSGDNWADSIYLHRPERLGDPAKYINHPQI